MDTFANCVFNKDKRQFEEILTEVMDALQEFEDELNIRKTTFFGGLYKSILFSNSLCFFCFFFYTPFFKIINKSYFYYKILCILS